MVYKERLTLTQGYCLRFPILRKWTQMFTVPDLEVIRLVPCCACDNWVHLECSYGIPEARLCASHCQIIDPGGPGRRRTRSNGKWNIVQGGGSGCVTSMR